jgi:hypothetical protein
MTDPVKVNVGAHTELPVELEPFNAIMRRLNNLSAGLFAEDQSELSTAMANEAGEIAEQVNILRSSLLERLAGMEKEARGWRCFHCHQVYTSREEAEVHFGRKLSDSPQCFMYPLNMREILNANEELRWFASQIIEGIHPGDIKIESPTSDETLENILRRGRAALSQPIEREGK